MPTIKVRENEPFDIALRRFRRLCDRAGVLQMLEKKSFLKSRLGLLNAKRLQLLKEHTKKWQKTVFIANVCTKRSLLVQYKTQYVSAKKTHY